MGEVPLHVAFSSRGGERGLAESIAGVPRSQETSPPQDLSVGICLGPCGGPGGGGGGGLMSEGPLGAWLVLAGRGESRGTHGTHVMV